MQTSERRQQLRVALVDAAERVIAERGLRQLKARNLAQAVGCALGAIYNVFPDLDGLVLEVNLRTLALFEVYLAQARDNARQTDEGNQASVKPPFAPSVSRESPGIGELDEAISELTHLAAT